jgi:hypothetical protein
MLRLDDAISKVAPQECFGKSEDMTDFRMDYGLLQFRNLLSGSER